MTSSPKPNQPNQSRLDRIEAAQERAQNELTALRQLIESSAKAIEAAGIQQPVDRELVRADRELSRQSREETRENTALSSYMDYANIVGRLT